MKTEKIKDYKPNYRRAVKGAALTVATAAMLGSAAGCVEIHLDKNDPPMIMGDVGIVEPQDTPMPSEDVTEMGYIGYENPDEEDGEELTLSGEIAIDEGSTSEDGETP